MDDLIKALTILRKYTKPNEHSPTHCEHDILLVMDIEQEKVSAADTATLKDLGFFWSGEYDCWGSFRFGSA